LALALLFASVSLNAKDMVKSSEVIMTKVDSAYRQEIVNHLNEVRKTRPTVAVVLGGGGAKGAAHIAVLEEIEKCGIPVDVVLGTSMGGLIGSLYALGHRPSDIAALIKNIDWDMVMNDKIPFEMRSYYDKDYRVKYGSAIGFGKNPFTDTYLGNVYGMQVSNLLSSLSVGYQDSTSFAKLPIPFVCMATDLVSGCEKPWYGGLITQAMRSTMSIPGVFEPVAAGDMLLVDGGMLNNLPTDVAKELGADIIIAVGITDYVYDKKQLSQIVNYASRLFVVGWAQKKLANYAIADLVIHPEVDKYGMLAFDHASIDSIMQRGYVAARAKKPELMAIKAKLGSDSLHLQSKPATQVITNQVAISGVEVQGVEGVEKDIVKRMLDLDGETEIGGEKLGSAISRVYASKAFNSVMYNFRGTEEPYTLVVTGNKGIPNALGIGLRADSEELLSALFNLGFNTRSLKGLGYDITLKLSTSPYIKGRVFYKPHVGPIYNAEVMGRSVNMSKLTKSMYTDNMLAYDEIKGDLFISENTFSLFEYRLGARYEWYSINNTVEANADSSRVSYEQEKLHLLIPYASARRSTMNDGYFPTRGYDVGLKYEFLYNLNNSSYAKRTHCISFNSKAAFSIGQRFTILPQLYFRANLYNHNDGAGRDPLIYWGLYGGGLDGRYLDHQISFIGLSGIEYATDKYGIAKLNLRYRVFKKGYLSAAVNGYYGWAGSSYREYNIGYGLEYMHSTPIGPLKLVVGSSTQWHKFYGYISIGRFF